MHKVGHATVADLERVPVKDLVEHMTFRKLLIEDLKKRPTLVATFLLKGGLYQMTFRRRFLLVEVRDCFKLGVNVRRWWYHLELSDKEMLIGETNFYRLKFQTVVLSWISECFR